MIRALLTACAWSALCAVAIADANAPQTPPAWQELSHPLDPGDEYQCTTDTECECMHPDLDPEDESERPALSGLIVDDMRTAVARLVRRT